MEVSKYISSAPPLTLPFFTPPLPDVAGLSLNWAELVVVGPLMHQCLVCRAIEHNERQCRQVNLVNLMEEWLAHPGIHRRLFLPVEGVQRSVAIEREVLSIGGDLVARQYGGIVWVIAKVIIPLS